MTKVLIVEDSRSSAELLSRRIRRELGFETHVASTLAQARTLLARSTDYLAALLDLNLPDAPRGESVDLALACNVPAVIFTGDLSDDMCESFWNRRIVDYVLKENLENVDYVVQLLGRLEKNPGIKILVVDDSPSYRHVVVRLLATHRYHVLEAGTGAEALRLLEEHPDIRLVTVDYNMPGMDGFALTREIRRRHGKGTLAVVGISGVGQARLSARFIKSGANDFLNKPFLVEEFYTRIIQNLEMVEGMARIRELAERDDLTGAYNRRYLFSAGAKLHALMARGGQPVTVAMLDIDHFKAVNDSLGHEAGDGALRQLANLLVARFRASDIVARIGGEEFCVLAGDLTAEQALSLFEELRQSIESAPVRCQGLPVPFTVSIGLCCQPGLGLEAMLRRADAALYRSKAAGRNCVSLDQPDA